MRFVIWKKDEVEEMVVKESDALCGISIFFERRVDANYVLRTLRRERKSNGGYVLVGDLIELLGIPWVWTHAWHLGWSSLRGIRPIRINFCADKHAFPHADKKMYAIDLPVPDRCTAVY